MTTSFTTHTAAGSEVLTQQIWNNQMSNIGSKFWFDENIKTGSTTYVYDNSDNLASGTDVSSTGSIVEWYEYDSNNDLISGHKIMDDKEVEYRYTYDSNGNFENEYRRVIT